MMFPPISSSGEVRGELRVVGMMIDEMKKTRRIAVVGAGAVGSYHGGRLWEGAANLRRSDDDIPTTVSFHLRGENYDYCIQQGIHISSYHGDFHIPAEKLSAYRTTEDMARAVLSDEEDGEDYDWIICCELTCDSFFTSLLLL